MNRVLPTDIVLLERGWLSSNNILLHGEEGATLVDTGYASHAQQTLALVQNTLGSRDLIRIVNTHGHSDHLGGNACLQAHFGCEILIPEGLHPSIADWDESALLLTSTGQYAPPFFTDQVIAPGSIVKLGDRYWQSIAAPGHDEHALAFFDPDSGILISGDALWENGFGVVFSELLGDTEGLTKLRRTLDSFARLPLTQVLPGHGSAFTDVEEALQRAYDRLSAFEQVPERMAWNGLRALLVFYMLEKRRLPTKELPALLRGLSLPKQISENYLGQDMDAIASRLQTDLIKAGALKEVEGYLLA